MQKIGPITSYNVVEEGKSYRFPVAEGRDGSRQVKFRTLAYEPVQMWIEPEDDVETGEVSEPLFLTVPSVGLDEIEFYITGEFTLTVVGGSIRLDTFDNAYQDVGDSNPEESFARIYERQDSDPRILEIQQMARHNQRRLEEQAANDRANYNAALIKFQQEAQDAINQVKSAAKPVKSSKADAGTGVPPASDSEAAAPADGGADGDA